MLEAWNRKAFTAVEGAARTLPYGTLTLTAPDGRVCTHRGPNDGPHSEVVVHDWRVLDSLMRRGDVGLAEAYRDGHWSTGDLVAVLKHGCLNWQGLDRFLAGHWLVRQLHRIAYALRPNSHGGSRRNVQAHYDLSNDFFRLWLDPSLTYSSAIFRDASQSLEAAQRNKLDTVLDRLGASPARLLEIGCGWGSFMERAIERLGHHVTGITVSARQHEFAAQRLAAMAPQAEVALADYRDQHGRFDHVVSIEMFEAVGEKYWPQFFGKVASLLAPGGRAVIQTITVRDEDFPRYRSGIDVFRSLIFPGGMLPSPARFSEEAAKAGLKVVERDMFGPHYARTAAHWLQAFDARAAEVAALGFDTGFIRLWRFYLATCVAVFEAGKIDVMQAELRHA